MQARFFGSLALTAVILVGVAAALVDCAATEEDAADPSEDQLTGVGNAMGLALRYDPSAGAVQATLKQPLADGDRLYVRVRRGKLTLTSQKDLDCGELAQTAPLGPGRRALGGEVVYPGPAVDKSIFDLVHLFDDPRWATGDVPASIQEEVRTLGPDPIVEACVVGSGKLRAKLQVNLAYAWDQTTKDDEIGQVGQGLHVQDLDGGGAAEAGPNDHGVDESNVHSQIEYGALCVQELGEIPFFKKIGPGKYETFDCRNRVGSAGAIDGLESARIPVVVDGVEQSKCAPGKELGLQSESYGCMDKADHGMFLATGDVQPGPMVHTAKNDRGTHWVLLCRKVADDGKGMTGTTVFNDMAMIGHNPKTGRTCFFQNSIGSGRDGAHVPHPADVEKSTTVWSSYVQSYCTGQCHAENAFVHSPWIDGAKRGDGHPIVPKIGELPDFPISRLDAPYNIVAADTLGFKLPKQLVSDEVGPCNNCHRLAGNTMGQFARWATGTGDEYFSKITETGKAFEASHWMPPRLDGLGADTWAASKFGAALDFMKKCEDNAQDPSCLWADIPRGAYDNPKRQ